VQLTAHPRQADAVAVLEHAFALGITHFDVARLYGFGRAEGILGKFLRGRRDQVTVATKFGLQPPSGLAGNGRLITAAKHLLKPFPGLLRRAKRVGSGMEKSGVFTPEAAIRSLETSLRELGTDYLDLLLLHEATLANAGGEALLSALEQQVTKGTVRHIGVASDFRKIEGNDGLLPAQYEVVQFNDNAWNRNLPKLAERERRLLITHSVFVPAAKLREAAQAHPDITSEKSPEIGADLRDPATISSLLLHYALRSNADGVVLFSSTNPAHIEANVKEARSQRFDDAQLAEFVRFVDKVLSAQGETGAGVRGASQGIA
jgi:aryl-alcohol dehydrogenase-like predicted oxidoreductase